MVLIFRKHLAPASPLEEQQTTADKTPTPSGELWWKATFVGSSTQPTPIIAFLLYLLWCTDAVMFLAEAVGGGGTAKNTLCIPAEGANTIAFRSDVQIDSH